VVVVDGPELASAVKEEGADTSCRSRQRPPAPWGATQMTNEGLVLAKEFIVVLARDGKG